jgi:predicted NACHT family NTPase
MLRENYNWQRFWCPSTGKLLLTEEGYLSDPVFFNPEVVSFESLMGVPCLVLLGEPGMGKSRAMQREKSQVDERVQQEGNQTLWFDLPSYSSEERLIRNIFQHPTFLNWHQGANHLHLFLDSLDECLLRIETLSSILVEEFKKCDAQRLSVRIACRTVEWQSILETGLREHWGAEAVNLYEIAPLRREDVAEAARTEGLEAETFLREISNREVVPLAAKPVTLRHLLRIYLETGQLPQTQRELYAAGCRLLCEEINPSYTDTRLRDEFSAEQRMMVAGRIAAVTVFANRFAVWTENDTTDANPEDVTFAELRGGYESINGNQFSVANIELREALNTGLFSSRGPRRMGWAHQTYAEFLAAWYLTQHQLSAAQLMSLIVHAGDREGKLVPQLHEAAAWMASMNADIRREIGRIEPDVLLRSDIAATEDAEKAQLVADLLRLYDEERGHDRDWSGYRRYHKLAHPNLAEQLLPYICDRDKKFLVRHIAIQIAEACNVIGLQRELADIALDATEQIDIRSYAARAVSNIADEETKLRLKPLAAEGAGVDHRNRLKGWALEAVWPRHMTARELFAVLTPPFESYAGSYTQFLSSPFLQYLSVGDLPVALAWVEEQAGHNLNYYLRRIVDDIILLAWEHLDVPEVAAAFARAALSRLRRHDAIVEESHSIWRTHSEPPAQRFNRMLSQEAAKRRHIIEEILSLIAQPDNVPYQLVYSGTVMVRSEDLPWMVECLQNSPTDEVKQKWAKLIRATYNPSNPDELDLVVRACPGNIVLATEIIWDLRPIILDSDEARQMRSNYERMHRRDEEPEEIPAIDPPIADRIEAFLDRCEERDWDAWWRLNLLMKFEADGSTELWETESNLKVMPGWRNADLATRARIVQAAKGYIGQQDAMTGEWLGQDIIYYPAYAGYRALRLLLEEEPDHVAALSPEVWQRWASIVAAFPTSEGGDAEAEEPHNRLVSFAYANAPEEVISTLSVMMDKENERDGYVRIPHKIELCWDDRLGAALLDKAKAPHMRTSSVGTLLTKLLAHDTPGAREYAESLITLPLPTDENEREKAVSTARALMRNTSDIGWPVVWPTIQSDAEFGREVIESAATTFRDETKTRWEQRLTEWQLAELYIWAVRQYPLAEDPNYTGFHAVSTRETIGHWRNSLLNMLKDRGTAEACENIERIMRELPELTGLKWALLEAQDLARRNNWRPVEPKYIYLVISDRQKRLVQNGEQLLEVIKESLSRFEQKLHDETPAVRDLWNEPRHTDDQGRRHVIYTPKEEEGFSDVVKRHLDADLRERGVIVNREVVIRRGTGNQDGERTDIHVDAITDDADSNTYQTIKVIIEVKGCWHRELNRAMESQLVGRYLQENTSRYGLYLVGWFMRDQWHEDDWRKGATPRISLEEARRQFSAQAAALSINGVKVDAAVIDAAIR